MQSIFNELKEGLSNGYGSRLATPDDHISKMFKKALRSIGSDGGKHFHSYYIFKPHIHGIYYLWDNGYIFNVKGNVKVKYIAIYGMVDTPDSPSSVARFTECEEQIIYKYEICNSARPWFESNNVFKYFMGLETGGYEITENVAKKFIEAWKENWPKSRRGD